jgi:hypothetical protein
LALTVSAAPPAAACSKRALKGPPRKSRFTCSGDWSGASALRATTLAGAWLCTLTVLTPLKKWNGPPSQAIATSPSPSAKIAALAGDGSAARTSPRAEPT